MWLIGEGFLDYKLDKLICLMYILCMYAYIYKYIHVDTHHPSDNDHEADLFFTDSFRSQIKQYWD